MNEVIQSSVMWALGSMFGLFLPILLGLTIFDQFFNHD